MGILDLFNKGKQQQAENRQNATTTPMPDVSGLPAQDRINAIPNTTAGINLKKSCINLDKSLVDLSKKSSINLTKHMARVAVVMDYSGSMSGLYKRGEVQDVLTRLMPMALRFDDNGELDVWIFDSGYHRMESMSLSNFDTYVKEEILSKGYRMGCTSYAPVLADVKQKYCKEEPMPKVPTFVIFITDGANDDKRDTDRIITELARENVFVQFVGIGSERFEYLEKLDNLKGRECDNTGFIKVDDFARLTDNQVYDQLLSQYPDWLKEKGLN